MDQIDQKAEIAKWIRKMIQIYTVFKRLTLDLKIED